MSRARKTIHNEYDYFFLIFVYYMIFSESHWNTFYPWWILNSFTCQSVLQGNFEDFYPKIYLRFISRCCRTFKALKILGEDCKDFLGKFINIMDKIVWKNLKICIFLKILKFNFPKNLEFLCWENLYKLQSVWQFLTVKHCPFLSIFKDIQRIWNLQSLFELTKNC